jgi:ActR/RegA family two-component response regulator
LTKKKIFAQGKKFIFNVFDEDLQVSNVQTANKCNLYPLEQVKYDYCLGAYFKMDKNIKETAKRLQISQNTLRVILKKNDKLGPENVINVNF